MFTRRPPVPIAKSPLLLGADRQTAATIGSIVQVGLLNRQAGLERRSNGIHLVSLQDRTKMRVNPQHKPAKIRQLLIMAFLMFAFGCGSDDERGPSSPPIPNGSTEIDGPALVNGDDWQAVALEDDPFRDLSPAAEPCRGRSHQQEYGGVEVDTSDCKHVTLSQPISVGMNRGDQLRVIGWHSQLYDPSSESAKGHMVLSIGSEILWAIERVIPGPPTSWDTVVTFPVDAPPGTPLLLHVRNHGGNSWNLYSLTLKQP